MTTHLTWLALADGNWFAKLIRSLSSSTSPTLQFTVFFGAFFLVVLGIFAWAAFYRKPGRHSHHHKHHHRHHDEPPAPLLAMPDPNIGGRAAHHHRRRKRRSRHKEPPRNPTLAETGGLPPVRGDESTENSSVPPG
jgi:hypothetical protein